MTPALSAQIAKYKTEIIGFLQRGHALSQSTIARIADDEPVPLSFAQERLWLLEQLAPGRSVYNLARAVRIIGPLDLRALQLSLSELVRRHESLRTKFVAVEGRPLQCVIPPQPVRLDAIDLSALPVEKLKKRTERLLFKEAQRPFDLAHDRLFRTRLLKERDDTHVLVFCMHHMITDAWSMGIFTRELWSLYKSFIDGNAPTLAEPALRYRDYALWQRQQLRDSPLAPHLAYWTEKLMDAPDLDLSTDRPRPTQQSFRGGRQPFELSSALTAAVNDLSRREGATLFMTLLAAFQLLLHRYSGQEDIVIGTPVANREHCAFEDVIGFFVNTLALRVDLSGRPSFKELLQRVREICLDAYAHPAAPFEKIVEALNPRRELKRNPIFQAMLVLQNTPRGSIDPPAGSRLEPIEIDNQTTQFDLSLYLREREGKLLGFIEYPADLFDAATIERMAGHYQTLLENAVADPGSSITTLPMLGAGERLRLLAEWNDTATEYPRDARVHELFEAQAERAPDAVALELANERLTYRELNRRANRLAYELSELGAGPGKLVGVMIERSFDLVAGILAILKAGAAYVPLDPGYPTERLNFMAADAAIAVLLTQRKLARRIATCGTMLFVDAPGGADSKRTANPKSGATADSPAYVIYTSGSTGAPKGVVALHHGAVNRFAWMWKTYPFGPNEKTCQKTPLSFVDSVWEIFGALLRGVSTVIVPETAASEPERLVHYLARHRVTRLALVPSLLTEILRLPDLDQRLAWLKFCFSSGAALPVALAAQFRQALPNCRLVNLYGSSEVSADVTYYEVDADPSPAAVSIGRPIDNTQIYVLDPHLQPVAIGVRGELYVGGDNIARGYFNRPELTAEKFIPNPFSSRANSRLFRTGDLARYRADGNLEFIGRADDQVKIRGCRVELGEVAAALSRHPDVRECSVIVHPATQPESDNPKSKIENPKCDSTIVAYVVPRERPLPAGELRAFLKERLPEYMLPARFVSIERMPQLPNGKVDRRALLAPVEVAQSQVSPGTEARSETEILVAQIWRQVLPVERIAVDDNFFALGGHSLSAAVVVAQLREAFNRPLALRDLFEAPTVAGLAALLERTVQGDNQDKFPPIKTAVKRRARLSLGQEPLFLFSRLFGGGDFLNMPYGYRLEGPLDGPALRRAILEIVDRHDILRAGFRETAAGARQFVRRQVKLSLAFVDLAGLPEAQKKIKLEEISRRDAAQCFDVEKPPLVRTTLLRLADKRHVLLVTMHHLITDQWSMGLFRQELAALYAAHVNDLPSPLPDLPVQFADFAAWQRALVEQGFLARQVSYWRNQLGGPLTALVFRRGARRAETLRFHSSRRTIEFNAALFGRIKTFALEQNCTPFMVFVAALNILLYRYTGQRDIRIGTLVANRGQSGTDGVIGYFVNALVLSARVQPDMTLTQFIKIVRATCLEAYAHQDLPFEYLETLMEKTRKGRRAPLYQIMLNYRNVPPLRAENHGLKIAPWNEKYRAGDPGIAISRLDVNFHFHELPTKLTGAVNYKTDLFDEAGITKLLQDYAAILAQMISHPERRVSGMAFR